MTDSILQQARDLWKAFKEAQNPRQRLDAGAAIHSFKYKPMVKPTNITAINQAAYEYARGKR